MDQLTRIEKLLERIAVALEKANEPVVVKQDWPASWAWPTQDTVYSHGCGPDIHVWTGPTAEDDKIADSGVKWIDAGGKRVWDRPDSDDKTSETCRNKFACAIDFSKYPVDDRFLTKEESHILNRAIKRSTIKAHGGKLEKD